jgi:hypothetical protein
MVRSRVISSPCASPGHFCCSVKIVVVRTVRFSTRPCPFSTLVWSRSGGAAGGGSGGKSRRDTAGAGLKAEAGGDVSLQAQLVALDREQVVAALRDDLLAHVTLAEHGIAEDDAALDRQDAQQFESGLVLVALGIDAQLGQHRLVLMGVGGHEMLPRRRVVATAA